MKFSTEIDLILEKNIGYCLQQKRKRKHIVAMKTYNMEKNFSVYIENGESIYFTGNNYLFLQTRRAIPTTFFKFFVVVKILLRWIRVAVSCIYFCSSPKMSSICHCIQHP
jgi:hypothetical protein